jgi:hypothetical protein
MSTSLYDLAKLHAQRMVAWLIIAITFVMASEYFFGHFAIAFAVAAIGLIIANVPMLGFNCPTCGKNLFFRGMFVIPWPNRNCGKCGEQLDRSSDNGTEG